ncbi:MAG: hypothetical protein ACLP01_19105 [Solirubrobacteraceae bacterium]
MRNVTSFDDDALGANRSAALSERQLARLQNHVSRKDSGILGPALRRTDPLAKDVREGKVASIEGAITKRILQFDGSVPAAHRIWVANRQAGNQEFHSPVDIYEAAPDGGFVRLFHLPRSRWVVNFELLPDPPIENLSATGATQAIRTWLGAASRHDAVGAAEARAEITAMGRQLQSYLPREAPPAGAPSENRPLEQAIIGSWESPFLTVSFRADGTLSARTAGHGDQQGRWSVDPGGRLVADVAGAAFAGDASVADDALTVDIGGRWLRLRRSTSD